MIVLDTSALVELLLALPLSPHVEAALDDAGWQVAAPQLQAIEVLQVLRRRVTAGVTAPDAAEQARTLLRELGVRYFEHDLLVERVWQLRDNLTAYDASYVALAELLNVDLVTTDSRLAHAPGNDARVVLLG